MRGYSRLYTALYLAMLITLESLALESAVTSEREVSQLVLRRWMVFSQDSLEFPDLVFCLSIGLVMARRSYDVLDSHRLECLFPILKGKSWVSITDYRGRYSMRCKNMVSE